MARLRVRNNENTDWIDICQSAWHIKLADGSWRRLYPADIKGRHGSDWYWCQINCDSGGCGDDKWGGIGTENPDHPDNGGDGGPNFKDPEDDTPTDWDDDGTDTGYEPDGPGEYDPEDGDGDGNNYDEGYDKGPVIEDGDGNKCVQPEGSVECIPYEKAPALSYCPFAGQWRHNSAPRVDQASVEMVDWKILDHEMHLGREAGTVKVVWAFKYHGGREGGMFPDSPGRITVYHHGKKLFDSGVVRGYDKTEFYYPGAENANEVEDGNVLVRIEMLEETTLVSASVGCPIQDREDSGMDPEIPEDIEYPTNDTGDQPDRTDDYDSDSGYTPGYGGGNNGGNNGGNGDGRPILRPRDPSEDREDGTDTDTELCIKFPDEEECLAYRLPDEDEEGGTGGEGTWDSPMACPTTSVFGNREPPAGIENGVTYVEWDVGEFIVKMGMEAGEATFIYDFKRDGQDAYGRVEVFHKGKELLDVPVMGAGRLWFDYDPYMDLPDGAEPTEDDTKILVRIRRGNATQWGFSILCPVSEEDKDDTDSDGDGIPDADEPKEGDMDAAAACGGTFEPTHGGNVGIHDMHHDMRNEEGVLEAGEVVIDYQMWYQPDTLEVWYQNKKLASTNGFVEGVGQLRFNFNPVNGDHRLLVRVISVEEGTSWVYILSCPGEDGYFDKPKACDEVVMSKGQSRNDTFWDLGTEPGVGSILYETWVVPDMITVYDNTGKLIAGSKDNEVKGSDTLTFMYTPDIMPIRVTVLSQYGGNWAYQMNCPAPNPTINALPGGSVVEGNNGDQNQLCFDVALDKPTSVEVLVDYTIDGGTATPGAVARTLAFDANNNPFLAMVDDGAGRIIMDGGFPKYYNARLTGTTFNTLNNEAKLLHNIVQWIRNRFRPTGRILSLGDSTAAANYSNLGSDGTDFKTTVARVASILGVNVDHRDTSHFGNPLNANEATLDAYDAIIFWSVSTTSSSHISPAMVTAIEAWRKRGNGIAVITDHDVFQGSANAIVQQHGAVFDTNINRAPFTVENMIDQNGDHPIWNNMTGSVYAGGSEGNITVTAEQGDYTPGAGTIVFAPGETRKQVCVPIYGDENSEPDETIKLTLSNPSVGTINTADSTGTVLDDDIEVQPCGGTQAVGGTTSSKMYYELGSEMGVVDIVYATVTGTGQEANSLRVLFGTNVVIDTGEVIVHESKPETVQFLYEPGMGKALVEMNNDSWWEYQIGCPYVPDPVEALIFRTTAEIENMKNTYTPPTFEDIFNTWPRIEGAAYYANKSVSSGDAAAWQLVNGSILQPRNVSRPNAIVSPDTFGRFTFEATVTSSHGDDDAIGIVAAYKRVGSVNHALVVIRTQGGLAPTNGYGLAYVTDNSVTILSSKSVGGTHGGWSGKRSRLRVVRNGNIVKVYCSQWNSDTILDTTEISVDLSTHANTGLRNLMGEASYGYWTRSQSNSTYKDVYFSAAGLNDKLFDDESGNIWEYQSGSWVRIGGRAEWSDHFGPWRQVTNTITRMPWEVKNNVATQTSKPGSGAIVNIGWAGPYGAKSLGGNPLPVGAKYMIEQEVVLTAGTYTISAFIDDTGTVFFNSLEVGTVGMNETDIVVQAVNGPNAIRFEVHNTVAGSPGAGYIALKNSSGAVVLVTDANWTYVGPYED